jgi:hypothetical protein
VCAYDGSWCRGVHKSLADLSQTVHKSLADLSQTYPEALAQAPAAAGPACRPSPLPAPQQTSPPGEHMVRAGRDGRGALREACALCDRRTPDMPRGPRACAPPYHSFRPSPPTLFARLPSALAAHN